MTSLPESALLEETEQSVLRILVVDDHKDTADSLAILAQLHGHDTQIAYSGADAIDAAARYRPDVILLDIGLPQISGFEVVETLRRLPNTRRTLIVAVTGRGDPESRARSKAAGFDLHFVKPVDVQQLVTLLSAYQKMIAEHGG